MTRKRNNRPKLQTVAVKSFYLKQWEQTVYWYALFSFIICHLHRNVKCFFDILQI